MSPGLYTLTMVGMGAEWLGQYQREARLVDSASTPAKNTPRD